MKNDGEADQQTSMQALETLGQFSGGIAHDFNNILSIIEGHTHLAVRQLKAGTLTPGHLQKILNSTQRGAGLTRRLLSYGREMPSPGEKTDLTETLRQNLVLLQPVLGDKIRVFITIPKSAIRVRASEDLLTQVIINLLLNARDAMPQGGEISILFMRCQKSHVPFRLTEEYPWAHFARLSIIDSGEGIPDNALPHIFEPLFTTKGADKGTGLGLSVVHTIVDELGGCIEVSSAAGAGTSFEIYLPLAERDKTIFCQD